MTRQVCHLVDCLHYTKQVTYNIKYHLTLKQRTSLCLKRQSLEVCKRSIQTGPLLSGSTVQYMELLLIKKFHHILIAWCFHFAWPSIFRTRAREPFHQNKSTKVIKNVVKFFDLQENLLQFYSCVISIIFHATKGNLHTNNKAVLNKCNRNSVVHIYY